jgi:hypothetical protein
MNGPLRADEIRTMSSVPGLRPGLIERVFQARRMSRRTYGSMHLSASVRPERPLPPAQGEARGDGGVKHINRP